MNATRPIVTITVLGILGLVLGIPYVLRPSSENRDERAIQLVILSPHHEEIRYEFGRGFERWHKQRYGQVVHVDWRNVGNTGQISRYISSEFQTAFNRFYSENHDGQSTPVKGWSRPASHQDPAKRKLAEQVCQEMLHSVGSGKVSIGVDLIFGGGEFEHNRWRKEGYTVPCPVDRHILKGIPQQWAGMDLYYIDQQPGEQRRSPSFDPVKQWRPKSDGYWYGTALSGFGIVYNRHTLAHPQLRLAAPRQWEDLAQSSLYDWIGLADPRSSGSTTKAFEMVLQQQIAYALNDSEDGNRHHSNEIEKGWTTGLNLIKRMGANARFFSQYSTRIPLDVASRNIAMGMAIDFYGRFQSEYVGNDEIGYINPAGGTAISPDPISMLRGAPARQVAIRFVEYVLSIDGQMLWDLPAGFQDPDSGRQGPIRTTNRRMPIRPDVYEEYGRYLKNQENPFQRSTEQLDYRSEYTARLFTLIRMLIGAMCIDTHAELKRAWKSVATSMSDEVVEKFDWLPITHAEAMWLTGADKEEIRVLHPDWNPSAHFRSSQGALENSDSRTRLALQWLHQFRDRYRYVSRIPDPSVKPYQR